MLHISTKKIVLSLSFISLLFYSTRVSSQVRGANASPYMLPGDVLIPGEIRNSPSNTYQLIYQTDGNLVLYKLDTGAALWSSRTNGSSANVVHLDSNGTLNLYDASWRRLWVSPNNICNGGYLKVTDYGEFVINAPTQTEKTVWGTRNGNVFYVVGYYPCYYP